jgi:hypothetical protein
VQHADDPEEETMSCWCGHEPWHYCRGSRYGYGYPPDYYPYEPAEDRPRARRRRGRDDQQVEDYLQDLAEEVQQLRRELAELRGEAAKS